MVLSWSGVLKCDASCVYGPSSMRFQWGERVEKIFFESRSFLGSGHYLERKVGEAPLKALSRKRPQRTHTSPQPVVIVVQWL